MPWCTGAQGLVGGALGPTAAMCMRAEPQHREPGNEGVHGMLSRWSLCAGRGKRAPWEESNNRLLIAAKYQLHFTGYPLFVLNPSFLQELAVASQGSGWSFTDEGRGKWGWVATEQGSSMQLKVRGMAP